MDLFAKKEKGKEILSENSVAIHFKSNGKFDVLVENGIIKVTPHGFANSINKGLIGQKHMTSITSQVCSSKPRHDYWVLANYPHWRT